jgi:hypothetical protein
VRSTSNSGFTLGLQVLELRGLLDPEPDDDAHGDQDRTEQERHPPRPGTAERDRGQEGEVGQQQPDREAGLGDAGVEPALAPRGVLEAHQDGPAPFGAERETLDHADGDQQDPGPHADLGVGGQRTDEHGGDTHQQQRPDQDRLASDAVAEVTADDPAEGAHREADPEGGEGEQRARQRIAGGEERGVEVQRRSRAEADEVVGLDRRADGGADRDPLAGGRALGRRLRGDDARSGRGGRWLPVGHGDLH